MVCDKFLTNNSRKTPHKTVPKKKLELPDNFKDQRIVGIIDNAKRMIYFIFLSNSRSKVLVRDNKYPIKSITITVVAILLV